MPLRIGYATPTGLWRSDHDERSDVLASLHDAGVDHIFMADHVSFHDGSGTDGLVEVAALSQLHPRLGVMVSVYLLPLRHPVPVARQLATLHTIAPGRLVFGVGVGGEDRHEIEVCGVDPATRGRRTDESLQILRRLMSGDEVTVGGEFFTLDRAVIKPAVDPPVPIIIGGRSDAALRRTARFGDGWVGAWCSVDRYASALRLIDREAATTGRETPTWQHGYQPWVGVADNSAEARRLVAREMERFYKIPFESFERYVPTGTPDEVAAALAPYVEAGCTFVNLKVVAANETEAVTAARDIASALRAADTIRG
jgi:alkanesulfonate monooxygenase SsuD/methylene tetrahydromethanopterin reductase-like flavin-dependent oxidoreductase (luciferase family)